MPHGGKRTGSGRKKTKLSVTGEKLKKVTAEEILAASDEIEGWHELLTATTVSSVVVVHVGEDGKPQGEPTREMITVPDLRIRLEARKYLTDKRDGKAPQALLHKTTEDEPFKVIVEHIGSANQVTAEAD
ncbi:MAG TPA: hypothetical protein VGK24_05710 [Candidatus Angelobacter sp.]|jgi:hypothetical protein